MKNADISYPVFTDMPYFSQFTPTYSPGIIEKARAADGYVPVEESVELAKVYAATILNMLAYAS